jgi:predicted DCC family thiol-disulfide oxidoreductase YuxK
MSTPQRMQVFYDGGCPVCSREIAFYRERPGADGFEWVDVHRTEGPPAADLSREAALARMHVRLADGTLVSGAAAFAAMWRNMPGLRWLGRWLEVPPFAALAEVGYGMFLRIRRSWHRTGTLE